MNIYYEQMIRAKLENGVQITLSDGKWSCADQSLAELLNSSQAYWRARENECFLVDAISQDHVAAAKVLAQFGGEVSFIASDRYVNASNDESVY